MVQVLSCYAMRLTALMLAGSNMCIRPMATTTNHGYMSMALEELLTSAYRNWPWRRVL